MSAQWCIVSLLFIIASVLFPPLLLVIPLALLGMALNAIKGFFENRSQKEISYQPTQLPSRTLSAKAQHDGEISDSVKAAEELEKHRKGIAAAHKKYASDIAKELTKIVDDAAPDGATMSDMEDYCARHLTGFKFSVIDGKPKVSGTFNELYFARESLKTSLPDHRATFFWIIKEERRFREKIAHQERRSRAAREELNSIVNDTLAKGVALTKLRMFCKKRWGIDFSESNGKLSMIDDESSPRIDHLLLSEIRKDLSKYH